jgi:autotransporter strand-loop-strand O-heptosyltransferase
MEDVFITYHFIEGPFVEISGGDPSARYRVIFTDLINNIIRYQSIIPTGHWSKCNVQYYLQWEVQVQDLSSERVWIFNNNLKGKDVHIKLKSYSLGDNIAWMPYVEEFRKKHECNVVCSCANAWRNILEGAYPEIEFIPHELNVTNVFARYVVDLWRLPYDWRSLSIQKIASSALGIPHHEIRARVDESKAIPTDLDFKYVCISEYSSSITNQWHYPGGWQQVVDYLIENGYRVVSVAYEGTKLENVINASGNPIEATMGILKNCEFFIGVASGLAWLSWALGKKVIMISGFTSAAMEFSEDNYRIEGVGDCVGCWNDLKIPHGDTRPCIKNYKCTRLITPDLVVHPIHIIQDNDIVHA